MPLVFIGWTQMVDEMLDSTTFTPRMRELTILRVAHLQDCTYELSQHVGLARDAVLTEAQITAILGDSELEAAGFGHTERAVLELVTELCTTHRLCEDAFGAVHTVLGDAALTELLMVVSCYYGLALVLNAADLDIDTTARLQV
ncbi:carboxymuconolactone decarboxylase family protein [Mycobacterium sp.]|jgi:4-carboxymuconolactone decarboxylase|uniref:carboxymuconolactone decarboxylase family protein n=1 Tax=Mycobacterium sp. TaxID=1785 RepID=UPI002C00CFFA|nr:carboxymuconolactone decarboxylase family protein [Mycobacterium sp.]HTH84513.1 carboxymuconolactone decarboxylase family protein [Mycobacterium sp.]